MVSGLTAPRVAPLATTAVPLPDAEVSVSTPPLAVSVPASAVVVAVPVPMKLPPAAMASVLAEAPCRTVCRRHPPVLRGPSRHCSASACPRPPRWSRCWRDPAPPFSIPSGRRRSLHYAGARQRAPIRPIKVSSIGRLLSVERGRNTQSGSDGAQSGRSTRAPTRPSNPLPPSHRVRS
jgi:hypothetical protein